LNDLSREMKERRKSLGGAEKIREQLRKLNDISKGPADRLAQAVSKGDFKKALESIDKLKQQLEQGDLSKEQQKQLADQLGQMEKTLKKMADAHDAAQEDLQKRVDQMRKSGQTQQASELEKQLDKLRQQMPQMDQMRKLSDQLKQCSQCMKNGKSKDAQQAMEDFKGTLEQMQKQLEEMEMLDEAMEQMAQARKQMNCKKCAGAGCQQCQGGQMAGQGRRQGLGEGAGAGPRPEEENDTSFYDSQVRQKVGRGEATVTDLVPGPNVAGDVREQIKMQVDSVRGEASNPLSTQRIPRKHRKHAKEYFDRFREGE
jgi:HAMP domain-containing protein